MFAPTSSDIQSACLGAQDSKYHHCMSSASKRCSNSSLLTTPAGAGVREMAVLSTRTNTLSSSSTLKKTIKHSLTVMQTWRVWWRCTCSTGSACWGKRCEPRHPGSDRGVSRWHGSTAQGPGWWGRNSRWKAAMPPLCVTTTPLQKEKVQG